MTEKKKPEGMPAKLLIVEEAPREPAAMRSRMMRRRRLFLDGREVAPIRSFSIEHDALAFPVLKTETLIESYDKIEVDNLEAYDSQDGEIDGILGGDMFENYVRVAESVMRGILYPPDFDTREFHLETLRALLPKKE